MIRLFNVSIPTATFILLIFETVLFLGCFVAATLLMGDLDPTDYLLYNFGLISLSLVVISFLLGLHFQNLYTDIRVKSRVLLVQKLCMVTGIAFLAQGLISFLDADLRVSVRVMLLGSAMAVPCVFLWRLWFGNIAENLIGYTRLVTVGGGPVMKQLQDWIREHPEGGLRVEASVERPEELANLKESLGKQQPPTIVFGAWGKPDPQLVHEMMELQLSGYETETAAATYEKATSRISLSSLRPEQLIYSSSFAVSLHRFFYQAVLNVIVTAFCMVFIAPILAITVLALRLSQRGPVLQSETVMGLNGQLFRVYCFRVAGDGIVAKGVRKLQLEGLPQFINVVKGEMRIIGPSPYRPAYHAAIERHIPFLRERCMVRPGMTGWAKIQSRRAKVEDVVDTLEYDLYYIKNRSLGLDTLILLHNLKSLMLEEETGEQEWVEEEISAGTR